MFTYWTFSFFVINMNFLPLKLRKLYFCSINFLYPALLHTALSDGLHAPSREVEETLMIAVGVDAHKHEHAIRRRDAGASCTRPNREVDP